jgi:hypothetical protein
MQIRKGLNSDLARLEYCDFSFTISHIAPPLSIMI